MQVYASTRSIWRGNSWSSIHVDIKLDNSFLLNKKNGSRFFLRAYLENYSSKGSYITDESVYIKLCFNPSRGANQRSLLVTSDPYNTLDMEVHKELFSCGDVFRVIVAAEDRLDGVKEFIFGASQSIAVTDLALSIDQRFLESPYCEFVEPDVFAWYSKCGGEKSCLSAVVQLKHSNNRVPLIEDELKLLTELVYEDGSPTPLNPMCPLKDRKSGKTSNKALFRMCSEPILSPGKFCASFSFRIEEVTFHHSGHHGFRLKISLAYSPLLVIHPAVSSDIIVVLSKPKSGLRIHDMRRCNALTISCTKKRKVSELEEKDSKSAFEIPVIILINGYRVDGKCLCCKRDIFMKDFLERELHAESCAFATHIVPAALGYCYEQEGNSDFRHFSEPAHIFRTSDTPLAKSMTVKKRSTCVSLPTNALEKSKEMISPHDGVMPVIHSWNGRYDSQHNPSNTDYMFGKCNYTCTYFPLEDTVRANKKHSLQPNHFSDKFCTEKGNTQYLAPNVCFSYGHQSDGSCIFPRNEKLIGNNSAHTLRGCAPHASMMYTEDCPFVTLKDPISMEENEKYLLQEFPVACEGVHTIDTDSSIQETFNMEETDEDSSLRLIDTLSTTCEIDSSNTKESTCIFSNMTCVTSISTKASQSLCDYSELGHDSVDANSIITKTENDSSSLYEPVALLVDNLNDSNIIIDHELVSEILSDTRISQVESLHGSPLAEVIVDNDKNTEFNFNPLMDHTPSNPQGITHPGQVLNNETTDSIFLELFSSPMGHIPFQESNML